MTAPATDAPGEHLFTQFEMRDVEVDGYDLSMEMPNAAPTQAEARPSA